MKIGKTLLPKGSKGKALRIQDSKDVIDWFPGIGEVNGSKQVIVKFDDLKKECIVHRTQIEIYETNEAESNNNRPQEGREGQATAPNPGTAV